MNVKYVHICIRTHTHINTPMRTSSHEYIYFPYPVTILGQSFPSFSHSYASHFHISVASLGQSLPSAGHFPLSVTVLYQSLPVVYVSVTPLGRSPPFAGQFPLSFTSPSQPLFSPSHFPLSNFLRPVTLPSDSQFPLLVTSLG